MASNEKILAFRRSELPQQWLVDCGSMAIEASTLSRELNTLDSCYLCRNQLENDRNYKQVIPYIICVDHHGCIACYPRHGREIRLHGLWSVGLGGHVDRADKQQCNDATIMTAAKRELLEETVGFSPATMVLKYVGILNEEQTTVGHCHIGVVFVLQLQDDQQILPRSETMGLCWLTPKQLREKQLELWSQLALELIGFPGYDH